LKGSLILKKGIAAIDQCRQTLTLRGVATETGWGINTAASVRRDITSTAVQIQNRDPARGETTWYLTSYQVLRAYYQIERFLS